MTTPVSTRIPYGLPFVVSLVASWTLLTSVIALAYWSGDRSAGTLMRWIILWLFSVVLPTTEAFRIHARLRTLADCCPDLPSSVRRGLGDTRWTLLMFGTMTVLTAFALGMGR